jgi:hypothetical protein
MEGQGSTPPGDRQKKCEGDVGGDTLTGGVDGSRPAHRSAVNFFCLRSLLSQHRVIYRHGAIRTKTPPAGQVPAGGGISARPWTAHAVL